MVEACESLAGVRAGRTETGIASLLSQNTQTFCIGLGGDKDGKTKNGRVLK